MIIGRIECNEDNNLTFSELRDKEPKTVSPEQFKSQYFDMICFLVPEVHTMIYDIHLPAAIQSGNIAAILERELSYCLPIDPATVVWCYKKLTAQNFKVFAMKSDLWEKYLALLRHNKLAIDKFIPRELLSTDGRYDTIYPASMRVPKDLRVIRHRNWKRLYWLLLFLNATVLFGIGYDKYQLYRREYDRLKNIKTELSAVLRQLQGQFGRLAAEQELQGILRTLGVDLEPLLPRLEELNQKLPPHMWLSNYVQNGNLIDISLESRQDEANFYRRLEGEHYQLVNLRKSQGNNGITIFYAKLKGSKYE